MNSMKRVRNPASRRGAAKIASPSSFRRGASRHGSHISTARLSRKIDRIIPACGANGSAGNMSIASSKCAARVRCGSPSLPRCWRRATSSGRGCNKAGHRSRSLRRSPMTPSLRPCCCDARMNAAGLPRPAARGRLPRCAASAPARHRALRLATLSPEREDAAAAVGAEPLQRVRRGAARRRGRTAPRCRSWRRPSPIVARTPPAGDGSAAWRVSGRIDSPGPAFDSGGRRGYGAGVAWGFRMARRRP